MGAKHKQIYGRTDGRTDRYLPGDGISVKSVDDGDCDIGEFW